MRLTNQAKPEIDPFAPADRADPPSPTPGGTALGLIFVAGVTLAGLSAFRIAWEHPAVLGPLGLMIGMTPAILLFEYSLPIPAYGLALGAATSLVSGFLFSRQPSPTSGRSARAVLVVGGALVALGVLAFVGASAAYNVGMGAEPPQGWYAWVVRAVPLADIGMMLMVSGVILGSLNPEAGE